MIKFRVIKQRSSMKPGPNKAYLVKIDWNDWFIYETSYSLVVFNENEIEFQIGEVKIGQVGLKPGPHSEPGIRVPMLPVGFFEHLSDEFFSLGQSDTYYKNLEELHPDIRSYILRALNDCAKNRELLERHLDQKVMEESLLRELSVHTVKKKFYNLANGHSDPTPYEFEVSLPSGKPLNRVKMKFQVEPESTPPTNVHAIIGRNGVGKTYFIERLSNELLRRASSSPEKPSLKKSALLSFPEKKGAGFGGLLIVSFSSFDFIDLGYDIKDVWGLRTGFLSLQYYTEEEKKWIKKKYSTKEEEDEFPEKILKERLALKFYSSVNICRQQRGIEALQEVFASLKYDPVFEEAGIMEFASGSGPLSRELVMDRFMRLSSGQAVVLLVTTSLLEYVEEQTLVLLDEPEGHLHPPLLSTLIRTLSSILIKKNGVAIICTHSPVVLQEIPKSCVWKLERRGRFLKAKRPRIETFGENVGVLTHEVFRLEVTETGFHKLLAEAIQKHGDSYTNLIGIFQEQLGSEALALLQMALANDDNEPEDDDEVNE